MNLNIETLSHRPLELYDELPPQFPGPRLSGGKVVSAEGDFGNLCIQEFDGGTFVIRYSVLDIKEEFILRARSNHPGVHAAIMLRNQIIPVVKNSGELKLKEGQFTILQADRPEATITFRAKQHYISFETMISHPMAENMLSDFPELDIVLMDQPPATPDIWINPPEWINEETKELIRYILNYTEKAEWRRHYFDSRVRDIFFQLLVLFSKSDPMEAQPTDEETDKAYAAEKLIMEDIRKHFIIPDLARRVGSNENRLKKIFKRVFRMGMHEYLVHQRLKLAIELLHNGLSVKETAARTGWRPADLIKAYYKKYGTTPGTVKKKNK